jgi:putative N-acetylmannosamine-6-phosphate epimerase
MSEQPIIPVPSQTRYPWKATLRTALAFIVGAAIAAPGLYEAVTDQSADHATGWGLTALVISSAITRLMANPFVNLWLSKVGLGATPTP